MWYETLLDTLFFVIGAAHVILAPYTKVEESFNLHAVHDILMYGVGPGALGNYDHFTFPGVVPRSFIGSLVLAYASTPLLWSLGSFGLLRSKLQIQVAVRLVLSSLNALSLVFIRRAASKRFGSRTGTWFTLLSCSQFHVMFWMGRTLPNMFALFPVNIVIGLVLSTTKTTPHLTRRAIMILTATAVILRAELVGLVGPLALFALIRRRVSIGQLIIDGAVAGCLAIGATILVDSHFWHQAWMWPEFAGIWFNVYEGKSAEWGVSPRHAYFTSHLPKLLMASLPLSVVGAGVNSYVRQLMLVVLVFVGLLSQLGHKEWRFVVYVVPLVNVGAARGAAWILDRRPAWRMLRRLLALGLVGLIALNVCATAFLTYVSSANYPGGEAMTRLHEVIHKTQASIFIDDLAAQSGASLFTQECSPPYAFGLSAPVVSGGSSTTSIFSRSQPTCSWEYFKQDGVLREPNSKITHAVLELAGDNMKDLAHKGEANVVLARVKGVERVGLLRSGAAAVVDDDGLQGVVVDGWRKWIPRVFLKDALWVVAL